MDATPPAASTPPRPRLLPPHRRPVPAVVSIGAEPAGLDRATWQRFRGGRLNASRKLDLHGMTTHHAYNALLGFLRSAHAERLRCVEVVTGRGSAEGGGAIRREFPFWLNLPDIRPLILAASHPHPANPGSVRLLLRRVR
ncbi:MAG: Smr/MutS family protein [Acetobacteraceae bacterium]